jgi:hypothetical protein
MTARVFALVRRKIAAKPVLVHDQEIQVQQSPLQHGRAVKAFVDEYEALQELLASAQSRNRRALLVDLLDRKRDLERRVRFIEVAR